MCVCRFPLQQSSCWHIHSVCCPLSFLTMTEATTLNRLFDYVRFTITMQMNYERDINDNRMRETYIYVS